MCVAFHGEHVKAPWIAVGLLGGQPWQGLPTDFFYACCCSFVKGRASVCFACDHEFVEGEGYLKVRKLDAGGNLFQNTWSSNCGCGCLLIFHVDPIRV